MSASFTEDAEERIREIVREGIVVVDHDWSATRKYSIGWRTIFTSSALAGAGLVFGIAAMLGIVSAAIQVLRALGIAA